jgi:hypothetical protein
VAAVLTIFTGNVDRQREAFGFPPRNIDICYRVDNQVKVGGGAAISIPWPHRIAITVFGCGPPCGKLPAVRLFRGRIVCCNASHAVKKSRHPERFVLTSSICAAMREYPGVGEEIYIEMIGAGYSSQRV